MQRELPAAPHPTPPFPHPTPSFATVDGTLPTSSNRQYQSVSSWGFLRTQGVLLQATDAPVRAFCATSCPLTLGIYGTRPGNFTVVVEGSGAADNLTITTDSPLVAPLAANTDGALIMAAQTNASVVRVAMDVTGFANGIGVLWGNSAIGVPALSPTTRQPVTGTFCQEWCW